MAQATILKPGEGSKFFLVGDHLTSKVEGQQTNRAFDAAVNYVPQGSGPPPHIHHREDEMFYVLEGAGEFIQDGRRVTAEPGTVLYLAKDVPHAFKSVGAVPLRMIVVTLPSGFAAFTAEAGEPITAIPSGREVTPAAIEKLLRVAPKYGLELADGFAQRDGPLSLAPEQRYWVLGHLATVKLTSEASCGNLCVAEAASPPGGFVPPHRHLAMHECFYVIEGEYEFLIEGKPQRAVPGTFIHIPPGTSHGFRNAGTTPARMADLHTPGGFERFFQECGTPCRDPERPPEPEAMDQQTLKAIFEKHGMELG
jgi:mannose-6-phosphate isomerase-like protein (cupin superfamily)